MTPGDAFFHGMSLLLDYPDSTLQAAWPALAAALEDWPAGRRKRGVQDFLAQAASQPPLRLQEAYTAAFDLDPAGSLNMTYHLWQDSEKRAGALVRLHQIYRDAGYEAVTGELPDYLPLMLEFIALHPEARDHEIVRACFRHIGGLAARVRSKAPAYAGLLTLLEENVRRTGAEAPAATPEESRADIDAQRSSSWN